MSPKAFAVSISDRTFVGTNSSGSNLNGDGDFEQNPDPSKDIWSWNLGLSSTTSTFIDPATNINIVDKTSGISGGVNWLMPTELEAFAGYSFASTPEENLTDSGPNLGLSYTINLKNAPKKTSPEGAEPTDDFVPSVYLKTNFSYLKYNQSSTTTTSTRRLRVTRTATATNAIDQNAYTLEGGISPLEWISLRYTFIKYNYSRDINAFLQYLDSPTLRTKSAGLSNAVSGFPTDLKETAVTFYPLEYWSLEFIYSVTVQASDFSFLNSTEGTLYRQLGQWKVGFGYKQEYSLASFDQIYSIFGSYRF